MNSKPALVCIRSRELLFVAMSEALADADLVSVGSADMCAQGAAIAAVRMVLDQDPVLRTFSQVFDPVFSEYASMPAWVVLSL